MNFISGIKDCSSSTTNFRFEVSENGGGPIYVMLNGDQKLSALPANFGKQFNSDTQVGIDFMRV